jgi:hypothetical protein
MFPTLKDWQALLAAGVALAAAIIAYFASMEKVNLDRELSDRDTLRRKLGIYLKLEFALQLLGADSGKIANKLKWTVLLSDRSVPVADMRTVEPPEINEAWEHLEMFPRSVIGELQLIRVSLRAWRDILDGVDPLTEWKVEPFAIKGNRASDVRELAYKVSVACENIVERLRNEVSPAMNGPNKQNWPYIVQAWVRRRWERIRSRPTRP